MQGEGLVQINVQLNTHQSRINIVDVLKPADDYIDQDEGCESQGYFKLIRETKFFFVLCSKRNILRSRRQSHQMDSRSSVQKRSGQILLYILLMNNVIMITFSAGTSENPI